MQTPFTTQTLPIQNLDYEKLLPLACKANSTLSNYNGFLSYIQNPTPLLNIITTQEAVSSINIEKAKISLMELLEHEVSHLKDKKKGENAEDVINYKKALEYGAGELANHPLSLDLTKEVHAILLQGERW